MKVTKLFVILAVIAALYFSANVFAQDFGKKTPEERAQKRADKMKEHLSLNDEQYKQVYDAILSQAQQIDALKADNNIDKTKKKEQVKSIRQSTDAVISGLLDKDQLTKYDKFKEKHKQKHMHKKKIKKHKKNKNLK